MFLDLCSEIAADPNLTNVIQTIYNAIRIAVPVILIIVGMVEMGKAIASQKEDEIKKAQSSLIKKAVAAVLVFLMLSLVKILVGVAGGTDEEKGCLDTILNAKFCGEASSLVQPKCTTGTLQCNTTTNTWECK